MFLTLTDGSSSSEYESEEDIEVTAKVSVKSPAVDVALALLATELGLSDNQADSVAR